MRIKFIRNSFREKQKKRTFCITFLRISWMSHTFSMDAINDVSRNANIEQICNG